MTLRIDRIPNRGYTPTVLIRDTWREGKRTRKETVCNITRLPAGLIAGIEILIQGGVAFDSGHDLLQAHATWPHGHVAAALGSVKKIGLVRILDRKPSRQRQLAMAAICARILNPKSKLATARGLSQATADSSLGSVLGLGHVSDNELLNLLDWLVKRQPWIQGSLARRHLKHGTMVLYDISSSYVEGRKNPLAALGYNRDGKKGKAQIVYGLLCATDGCPVAIEVFAGNTRDCHTVVEKITLLQERYKLRHIALVGDRGMITTRQIRDALEPAQLDWISALNAVDIRTLVKDRPRPAAFTPEQLTADGIAEIYSEDFPGERLLVCFNPRQKLKRQKNREQLLRAVEHKLNRIAAAVYRKNAPLRGVENITARIEKETGKYKMRKHFNIQIGDDELSFKRRTKHIEAESRLDGIYVIRTSLSKASIGNDEAVQSYKNLCQVEAAFRSLKSLLKVRPIFVYDADHTRGHVFLCLLAYYVQWHMRQRLAPLLFEDDDKTSARAKRPSPVSQAQPSDNARYKAATKHTLDGDPVNSFETLMAHLSTLNLIEWSLESHPEHRFTTFTEMTDIQRKAFELLDIKPESFVPSKITD